MLVELLAVAVLNQQPKELLIEPPKTETVQIEKKEPVKELTLAEKIKKDVNDCEPERYISAEDASCLPKPVKTAPKVQTPVRASVRTSGSYRNDMYYGYCTYWAKSQRSDLPTGLGDARFWYPRAESWGLPVGSTPQVGAVAWTDRGADGHVSIVEKIDGDKIYVSEMNVEGWNVLSYAWYPAGDYLYIY